MTKIDISHKTIIFTVFFLIGLWLLYQIRGVILLWFIAIILMTALNQIVCKFESMRVPRILGIILSFILAFAFVSLIVAGIVPTLIEQTGILANVFTREFALPTIFQLNQDTIANQLEGLTRNAVNVLRIVAGAFSNILTIFTVIVLTFYLLVERKNLKHYLKVLFHDVNSEHHAEELITAVEKRLGGWVLGELALMFIIGTLTYIGLTLLGIPFALPLALLAGLLELVPNIGPIIASIPAIIAGLTISPILAGGVAILYFTVQQLENNIIVPMVMRQSVGLPPLVTLLSLMVGAALGGIVGAVLAVPLFITAEVIIRHIYKYRKALKQFEKE